MGLIDGEDGFGSISTPIGGSPAFVDDDYRSVWQVGDDRVHCESMYYVCFVEMKNYFHLEKDDRMISEELISTCRCRHIVSNAFSCIVVSRS